MWRTQGTLIYKRTKNLRAAQLLLEHSKIDYLPFRTLSRGCCLLPASGAIKQGSLDELTKIVATASVQPKLKPLLACA
jgi:hypothetical protein